MCGRYSQQHTSEQIARRFEIMDSEYDAEARYNIAPSQIAPIIIAQMQRRLVGCKWGLVPFWAKDASIGNRMINAKAETLAEKPAFKYAISKRRCLIPADGLYEWKKQAKGPSQPFYLRRRDRGLFAFAGLWEGWTSPEGEKLRTFTIITVEPNDLVSPVHNRMAAILKPEHERLWLDPSIREPADVVPLLAPYPSDELEMFPVSRSVNSPALDQLSLIEPLV
ncbi:MAG: SOS response-associated peptidase [Acidobacteriota bacterium]